VLLAEDDLAISDPLARALRREGYDVVVEGTGPAALAQAGRSDMIILDIGLPHMDGLEVCRRIRAQGHRTPVIVLTARTHEVDAVVGLDAGADDYVSKPFRLGELLARIRAQLRRGQDVGESIRVQDVEVDVGARRVRRGAQNLELPNKQFDLLVALLRHAGSVMTREELMREVWQTTWLGSTKTVDMHISWLRRKLGDAVGDPRYITTVRGIGFRFEEN